MIWESIKMAAVAIAVVTFVIFCYVTTLAAYGVAAGLVFRVAKWAAGY